LRVVAADRFIVDEIASVALLLLLLGCAALVDLVL
jgi:hypothetical protein